MTFTYTGNRNRLLTLDLGTSIVTLGMSTATLFVGLFGMNLTSHLEEHPQAFYIMSAVAYVMALVVTVAGLRRLSKLRRIGLSVGGTGPGVFGVNSTRKPDARHVSHARAWWWRENQFQALRREKTQQHARDAISNPHSSTTMHETPLHPGALNASNVSPPRDLKN